MKYKSSNILSVNRFVDYPYEKSRKYHSDVHGGIIFSDWLNLKRQTFLCISFSSNLLTLCNSYKFNRGLTSQEPKCIKKIWSAFSPLFSRKISESNFSEDIRSVMTEQGENLPFSDENSFFCAGKMRIYQINFIFRFRSLSVPKTSVFPVLSEEIPCRPMKNSCTAVPENSLRAFRSKG